MSRRFRRRPTKRSLLFLLVVVLLITRAWRSENGTPPPESLGEGPHQVRRVVDGDTLLLDDSSRVRLLGIDAPELARDGRPADPWADEATTFARKFIADGKVRLDFDQERKDTYDRFLAYVWVGDRMLNEELVRAGLAYAGRRYRYSATMKQRFLAAEDQAKAAQRGMWAVSQESRVKSREPE